MADEALRELVDWLRAEAVDAQSWGNEPYRTDQGNVLNARADALESALSELARLRAERDSRMDQSKTVTADAARDHPTDRMD